MCTGFCWENLKERNQLRGPDVDGRIILRWIEGRDVLSVLLGKPEGKKPLVRTRRRWEDNINMDGRQRKHRFLVGKSEGKRPLERPRRRWEDNIKVDGGHRYTQVSGG
jgi:hypothetical protein